jgi:hypothetical protein
VDKQYAGFRERLFAKFLKILCAFGVDNQMKRQYPSFGLTLSADGTWSFFLSVWGCVQKGPQYTVQQGLHPMNRRKNYPGFRVEELAF